MGHIWAKFRFLMCFCLQCEHGLKYNKRHMGKANPFKMYFLILIPPLPLIFAEALIM